VTRATQEEYSLQSTPCLLLFSPVALCPRHQQLLSFQSTNEEVLDVQWCPFSSTVFGAVTAGGRLELWDFSVSTLKPVAQHTTNNCSMTALLFGVVSQRSSATRQFRCSCMPVVKLLLL